MTLVRNRKQLILGLLALVGVGNRENNTAYESAWLTGFAALLIGLAALGAFVWLLSRYVRAMAVSSSQIHEQREAELKQQAAALLEADRRKDEFLAILVHEFRNPLSPISNALHVWNFVKNDQEQMQQLHQIMQRQVQQLSRLVDDLLDFSRMTRGKIELHREAVPLAAAISRAVEAARPLLDSGEHELAIAMGDDTLVVEGDNARLTQIFGNILQNAAKFTGRHGKIEICVRRHENEAVVAIKDNGPGIPAPTLSRIFEVFRHADQTAVRSHGGLGIGLALVKKLVELHGGRIEARSEGPDQGSEFVVTLPLMLSPPSQTSTGEDKTNSERQSVLPQSKVLVVDDVQASAKTLAIMLRAIGQHATVLYDGAAAVDWVIEHRPEFVFLDIAMPGISGYEVARQIRARDELREVFLVALTGYSQDEDRRRTKEAGFDQHLTKPTSIDQLQELFRGHSRRMPEE